MEGVQISLSEVESTLEQREISKERINKTLSQVQNSLAKQSSIDVFQISFSEHPGEQNWSASGCYIADKKKWGSIKFGKEVPIKSDFLENKLTTEELSKVAHEYTHLVTSEFETNKSEATVHQILQEGVAVRAEVNILNSESLYDVVDYKSVINHCGRLVQENKNIILDPKSEWQSDTKLEEDEIREILMNSKLVYDGFSLNRGLLHIAGIYFVGSVLGPRIDLSETLYKNPPTFEEIIDPIKYKNRVKIDLEQPIKEVIPQIPIVNPI
jgi:hypothetical protein